jgi:hypothetical protein
LSSAGSARSKANEAECALGRRSRLGARCYLPMCADRRPPGTVFVVLSLALAAAASTYLLSAPAGEDHGGSPPLSTEDSGFLDNPVLGVAAVAISITVVPLVLNRTRWRTAARNVSATVLLFGSLLGAASYGLPYFPAAVAMVVAAVADDRKTRRRNPRHPGCAKERLTPVSSRRGRLRRRLASIRR